jgi:hypothetical protein
METLQSASEQGGMDRAGVGRSTMAALELVLLELGHRQDAGRRLKTQSVTAGAHTATKGLAADTHYATSEKQPTLDTYWGMFFKGPQNKLNPNVAPDEKKNN